MIDPLVAKKMELEHVRGVLLHGPPGTGKTLVAKALGELLHAHPPKIVNGPEILQRFVGQSEENIRGLFADAELEYKIRGEESKLHVIVFDEIDAVCKARGSGGVTASVVHDNVVNQLLTKLDGMRTLNNVPRRRHYESKRFVRQSVVTTGSIGVAIRDWFTGCVRTVTDFRHSHEIDERERDFERVRGFGTVGADDREPQRRGIERFSESGDQSRVGETFRYGD